MQVSRAINFEDDMQAEVDQELGVGSYDACLAFMGWLEKCAVIKPKNGKAKAFCDVEKKTVRFY